MGLRDKIFISKDETVQGLYEKLKTERGDSPTKPFRFDRDIFLAAAAIGQREKQFKQLDASDRKDKFTWGTLLNDPHALAALRAIALAHEKNPEVLLDDDRVASIAEGYANAGIHILAKRILNTGVDELEEAALYMSGLDAKPS
jgi:dnd system-associated protein 4